MDNVLHVSSLTVMKFRLAQIIGYFNVFPHTDHCQKFLLVGYIRVHIL
jgi:hypothetical protein